MVFDGGKIGKKMRWAAVQTASFIASTPASAASELVLGKAISAEKKS